MSTTAAAMDEGLSEYRGQEVIRTSIAIRNAGDGLSEAMTIAPIELPIGSTVFVVLECEVAHHDYGPVKDTKCLELKQVLKAGTATLVDGTTVAESLDRQRALIEEARAAAEAEKGIQRLDFAGTSDEEFELASQHALGNHADERVDGCPVCQSEIDAEEAEAIEDAAAAGEDPPEAGEEGTVTDMKARRTRKRGGNGNND